MQYEKSIRSSYEVDDEYELVNICILISSSKIDKLEVNTVGWGADELCIRFDNWIALFENNICTYFLIFFKNNINKFSYFFDGLYFDSNKYRALLNLVNDII